MVKPRCVHRKRRRGGCYETLGREIRGGDCGCPRALVGSSPGYTRVAATLVVSLVGLGVAGRLRDPAGRRNRHGGVSAIRSGMCRLRGSLRGRARRRIGWLALVTALLGWAVGEIIWAVYEVRPELEHATHPAAAEIVLLLWPIGAMASLVLLSHAVSPQSPATSCWTVVIVATSLFVISWVFVARQTAARAQRRAARDAGAGLQRCRPADDGDPDAVAALVPSDLPSRSLLAGGIVTISVADIAMVFQHRCRQLSRRRAGRPGPDSRAGHDGAGRAVQRQRAAPRQRREMRSCPAPCCGCPTCRCCWPPRSDWATR